jgi:hypothetical protein
MTKFNLTDHQRCALRAASRSANINAWPLPQRLGLSKGSATIVAKALLKKGLVEERPALGHDAIWSEAEDGRPMTLVITRGGLAAVGMLPEIEADRNSASDLTQKADKAANSAPTTAVSVNERRMPRAGSKLAMLVALLERDGGATVEEAAAVLGWQAHTVRAVLSATLTRKFGLAITSEKREKGERRYRIVGGTVDALLREKPHAGRAYRIHEERPV